MAKLNDLDLINYIINQEASLKEAAEYFNVSLSTVKKVMQKTKEKLKENPLILEQLNEISRQNVKQGRVQGSLSHNSGIKRAFKLDEIASYAMKFIAYNLTLEQASKGFGIPSSTLWDNFNLLNCDEYRELYGDLLYVYKCHNKNIRTISILDAEYRGETHNNTWLESIQRADIIKLEKITQKYNRILDELQNKPKGK